MILAAVDAFFGNLRTGLDHYSDKQIISNGQKLYPDADDYEDQNGLRIGTVFDEVPTNWIIQNSGGNKVNFTYIETTPFTKVKYSCSGNDQYQLEIIDGSSYRPGGSGGGEDDDAHGD